MTFTAAEAYALCYWLDNLKSHPPTSAPYGWDLAFAPDRSHDPNYAVVLCNVSNPTQLAVVTMGTKNVIQMLQDTEVGDPKPFTIIAGAKVANGVDHSFKQVLKLRYKLETLEDYLTKKVKKDGCSVLVTGHSLGGAVTTLLAPRLASVIQGTTPVTAPLPSQIQAITFAAFAAGNQQLADYLNGSPQYVPNINVNDIIPYVWATTGPYNVNSIYNMFASPGPTMPSCLQTWLQNIVKKIPSGFNYVQTNEPNTFTGTILPAPFSTCGLTQEQLENAQWEWEVSLQHNYAYCVEYIQSNCQEPSSDCPKNPKTVDCP